MAATFLGIEIGGTKLQLVSGDDAGRIHHRRRLSVQPLEGGAGIRRQIESALPELLSPGTPAAIGVGFGGPVDWRTGAICCSHQVEGWSNFNLGEWLGKMSGVPVFIDNDANVAALGEARHGAGEGFDSVFYVTLGSGVGAGLVVRGEIFHGAKPGESEIGHVRLDREGTLVEQRCSGWAVDKSIRELVSRNPNSVLNKLIGEKIGGEARFLSEALRQGDMLAGEILRDTATHLAFGLSHVVHLMHPEVIVLGGGLSLIGEPLRSAIAEVLPQFIMEAFHPGPEIRLAALGEDSVTVGALTLARERLATRR